MKERERGIRYRAGWIRREYETGAGTEVKTVCVKEREKEREREREREMTRERQNKVKGQVHRYRKREVYRCQVKSKEGERGVENERA